MSLQQISVESFVPWGSRSCSSLRRPLPVLFESSSSSDESSSSSSSSGDTGEVGTGPNWIERSFPVSVGADEEGSAALLKKVEDYNLGISGVSFQTGPLSRRMFDAIMSNNQLGDDPEIQQAFTLYAMDFTAKEATKAALNENGLEMVLSEEEEDAGMWGDVDTIQLLDEDTNQGVGPIYDSTEEAIESNNWTPGQSFNFVVRQVPARIRKLTLEELRDALNPENDVGEFE